MRRLLSFLSVCYAIYALLVAWFIGRLLVRVYTAQSAGEMQVSGIQWVPLVMITAIAVSFIAIFLCLALFLSGRRSRRAALVLAWISCIGIPVGTILGGLTIYALTRPEIRAEFTPTI